MAEIFKYTSWLTAYLLLCGFLKFYLYYKQFNISILRFIDFTEIITLFMDNLFGYLLISIPLTISTIFIYFDPHKNLTVLSAQGIFCRISSELPRLLILLGISLIALLV